jgi:hypothetical protein
MRLLMKSLALNSLILRLILLLPTANAQTTATVDTVDTSSAVWHVQLNINKLFASPLGETINEIIYHETPDGKVHIDAAIQALGFDPRTSIQDIVVFGDDFQHTSGTAVANMGSTRGNLEGWLLAAPGYKSEDVGKTILHSFDVEDKELPRLWVALPKREADNNYLLVAGFDSERVRSLINQVAEGGNPLEDSKLDGEKFLALVVNDLSKAPIEIDENEPGSAIIKTIQSLVLSVGSEGNQLASNLEITTDSAARAEQLNQLIVGMKAMVQLAIPQKGDDDMKQFAKYLGNLTVDYPAGSNSVSAKFLMDYDEIKRLIEENHKSE